MEKFRVWRSLFLALCMMLCLTVWSQEAIPNDSSTQYAFTDVMPEFPGGNEALYKFLGDNYKYPKLDRKNKIEGKIVTKFLIDTNGYVQDITIIKSVSAACDAEAIRVLKLMPKWKPGMQNNKPVNVYFTLPIKLVIPDDEPITPKQQLIAETIGAAFGITITILLVGWYRRTF